MKPASIYPPERIHSKCVGNPYWHEIGGWTEILLGVFGVHKSGYRWLKRLVGLQPQCGCEQRQHRLNDLGRRLAARWVLVVEKIKLFFNLT